MSIEKRWDGANERLAYVFGGLTAWKGFDPDCEKYLGDTFLGDLIHEWLKRKRQGVKDCFERGHEDVTAKFNAMLKGKTTTALDFRSWYNNLPR